MRQKSGHAESSSERIVKDIRRATRKRHLAEEKIRTVLDGLRAESSIDDRKIVNAIFSVLRTVMPWRDLPAHYGRARGWRRGYPNVLDDAAFGAATEVKPKFVSPADPAAR